LDLSFVVLPENLLFSLPLKTRDFCHIKLRQLGFYRCFLRTWWLILDLDLSFLAGAISWRWGKSTVFILNFVNCGFNAFDFHISLQHVILFKIFRLSPARMKRMVSSICNFNNILGVPTSCKPYRIMHPSVIVLPLHFVIITDREWVQISWIHIKDSSTNMLTVFATSPSCYVPIVSRVSYGLRICMRLISF